jgi:uncharacterized protein (TIGR02271 family)
VEATDGRLGTVDEVRVRPATGELAVLVVRRGWSDRRLHVAAEQVAGVDGDGTVRLRGTRAEAGRAGAAIPDAAGVPLVAGADGAQLRVPVRAERLRAEVRAVDLGELRVTRRVETAEETVRQAVAREEVDVERVPVNRPLTAPVAQRTEGEWLVLPVMEEVLVVRTQLMLKEEVRIRTRRVVAEQAVTETVRRERVELEDATRSGVHDAGGAPGAPGAGASGAPAGPPAGAAGPAPPAAEPAGAAPDAGRGPAPQPRAAR